MIVVGSPIFMGTWEGSSGAINVPVIQELYRAIRGLNHW